MPIVLEKRHVHTCVLRTFRFESCLVTSPGPPAGGKTRWEECSRRNHAGWAECAPWWTVQAEALFPFPAEQWWTCLQRMGNDLPHP